MSIQADWTRIPNSDDYTSHGYRARRVQGTRAWPKYRILSPDGRQIGGIGGLPQTINDTQREGRST